MTTSTTYGALVGLAVLILAGCDTGEEGDAGDGATADGEVEVATPEEGDVPVEGPEGGADGDGPAAGAQRASGWSGPPSDQIGAIVAVGPVLVEGDDAVVALVGLQVFGDGMDLSLAIRWDPAGDGAADPMGGPMDTLDTTTPPESEDGLPEELLRVELVYPNGSTASTIDHLLATAAGEAPEEPALNPYMGAGTQTAWDQQLWAWPLPNAAAEAIELIVDWPAQGIDSERVELTVTAAELVDASERAILLWE